ncbi:MAG: acetyl-CoA carboxylase biotin carboxylase subunit [Chloroflexi bacterium]|nr:acetyl-CoA carboxylase biotin carboxylase subunit [Chloroflexota bacterium]
MFRKMLIANRGEIAVRLIHACHELGIRAVAVYSDADADALHVRLADEAVHIGPAPPAESYLRGDRIIEAARATGCEAIHPGYGFLAEAPDFARAVREAGLVFVGPSAEAIRRMGVKTEARALMQAAGVPVVPGYQGGESAADEDFLRAADAIGYPVMVKAAGGGGGKGIRVVRDPADLPDALASARREAAHAFGDPNVFLEKFIEPARHIEVQVLADEHGRTVHLFERECSIQRRHQKIIEESPSPAVTPELRARMGEAAVAAARVVGYANAGTVEFIVGPAGDFYFLEMNTRLQVEHPVTEMVTGVDLVTQQIRIAAGEPLPFTQEDLSQRGHAIECRVYAEDPASGFLPATGPVLRTVEPAGPGVRVDAGVVTGDEVTIHYDPMIAKGITFAGSRADAIRKMDWALAQYVILGVTTNLAFLRDVLRHPDFVAGTFSTRFVDEHFELWAERCPDDLPDHALIALALSEVQMEAAPAPSGAAPDADRYSPWARLDAFRLGE